VRANKGEVTDLCRRARRPSCGRRGSPMESRGRSRAGIRGTACTRRSWDPSSRDGNGILRAWCSSRG
jgi:hypothetical protein